MLPPLHVLIPEFHQSKNYTFKSPSSHLASWSVNWSSANGSRYGVERSGTELGGKDNLSNYSQKVSESSLVVLTLVRFECWIKQEGLTKVTCSDPMHAARGRACVPRDPACKVIFWIKTIISIQDPACAVIFILDKDCHPEDCEDRPQQEDC